MAQQVKDSARVTAAAWVAAVAQVQSLARKRLHVTGATKNKKKIFFNFFKSRGQEFPLWHSGLRILLQQLRSLQRYKFNPQPSSVGAGVPMVAQQVKNPT